MKKLLAIALITGVLAACGSNENRDGINRDGDSTVPVSPDTSRMNTDTTRMNTDTTGARTNP